MAHPPPPTHSSTGEKALLAEVYANAAKGGKEGVDYPSRAQIEARNAPLTAAHDTSVARQMHDNAPHLTDGVVIGLNLAAGIVGSTGVGDPISTGIKGLATVVDGVGSALHGDSPERQAEVWRRDLLNMTPAGVIQAVKDQAEGHLSIDPTTDRVMCRNMPEMAAQIRMDCSRFITAKAPAAGTGGMPDQPPVATPATALPAVIKER